MTRPWFHAGSLVFVTVKTNLQLTFCLVINNRLYENRSFAHSIQLFWSKGLLPKVRKYSKIILKKNCQLQPAQKVFNEILVLHTCACRHGQTHPSRSSCFCDKHLATSAHHRLLSELSSEPRCPFSKRDTSYPKAVVRINQNKVQRGSWHNIWHSTQSFSQLSDPVLHLVVSLPMKGAPDSQRKTCVPGKSCDSYLCQLVYFPFIHSLENCLKWAHGKQSRN